MRLTVYERIKDAENPSPRIQKFFKKYKDVHIWSIGSDNESIKKLESKKLKDSNLILGTPSLNFNIGDAKEVRSGSYCGRSMNSLVCSHTIPQYRCVVGYGRPGKGVWFVDVTEKFIEEYNKIGKCAIHDHGHEFLYVSPRKKQCKFCKVVYKKKIIIKKEVEWVKTGE